MLQRKRKPMFKTPRLLLEYRTEKEWVPVKIFCNFNSVRNMLDNLPQISEQYGGVENVRVKYLATHDQIAQAKFAIDRHSRKKDK